VLQVAEPAQVLAAALLVVPPVAVQLQAVAQPQAAQVLQPVVPVQRPVVQPRRAVLLQPAVRPQLVPALQQQVLPLRRVLRQLQLQPRWVWWQPVWLLRLWWLLQQPRRPTLFIKIPPRSPVRVPIPPWL